ncbi:MAG TPA: hypothetical protein VKA21_01590, partial [Candidatus Binatia bacterium]|nr:hypothetical protein [Candidatus Binatia bacterium]
PVADVAPPPEPSPAVSYAQDRVSVRVKDMPLADVLAELGRSAGLTIHGRRDGDARPVSTAFEDVPLPDALQRLLGDSNFVIVYDERHRPRTVELLGAASAASPGRPLGGPAGAQPPMPLESLAGRLEQSTVVLGRRLGDALGTPSTSLRALCESAIQHEDATVRGDAMRLALRTIDRNPDIRDAILASTGQIEDTMLVNVIQRLAGPRTQEALTLVATHGSPALRTKAQNLLTHLSAD